MSESFEDVLKEVLVTEKKKKPKPTPKVKRQRKRENYVSEALNSNSMPNTMTPAGYSGGPRGMPPFSKYTVDAPTGSIDMRDIGKQDEEFAKSEQRKPYPLETILDYVTQSGLALKNAESLIETALRNDSTLTQKNKEDLKKSLQMIKSSFGNVSKSAKMLDGITIS